MENNFRELEEELTCGICQELYTDPRILPCLHYYCKRCIIRLALVEGFGHPFPCPQCRRGVVIEDDSEESIRSVFFINRLKDVLARQKMTSDAEKKCSVCLSSNSELQESSHDRPLCTDCAEKEHRGDDIGLGHQNVNPGSTSGFATKCKLHNEQLKIYCFDCKVLICCECTVKDHCSHAFKFVKEAATSVKEELRSSLLPLKKAQHLISGAVEVIEGVQEDISVQGAAVVDKIEASFASIQAVLEKHKNELVEEVQQVTKKKAANINAQLKNAVLMKARVQSVVDFTEQIVEHFSERDVVVSCEDISDQIKQTLKDCEDVDGLKPVEQADQDFENSIGEVLQRLCENKARVFPSPLVVTADKLLPEVEYLKASTFDLSISLANKNLVHRKVSIKVELKSVHNDKISPSAIESLGSSKYRVRFKPSTRGRHSMNVYLDDSKTPNRSYPVFVSIHPDQLAKPTKFCPATKPSGIAVNTSGEIIVTEFTSAVTVFDRRGKKLRHLDGTQYRIKHFQAVATDEQDNLYLPDADSSLMLKTNSDFSNVRVFSIKQQRGPGHIDAAVVQQKVLLTEYFNEGSISMYTQDMKPLRVIYGTDNGIMRCLSSDHLDNIYVTHASGVLIFNVQGELMGRIGNDKVGRGGKTSDPWGVAVFRQLVFVGDRDADRVIVYNLQGKFTGSLKGYGCMAADKDGFLHIAKFTQNTIYVS